jgi:hypothetical protein
MKTNKTTLHEISLALDERNLAHVFSALALAAIAEEKMPCEASRCWWTEDAFCLRLPQTLEELFNDAHQFVKSIRWTAGIGCVKENKKIQLKAAKQHGFFTAANNRCGNPLINYHDQGMTPSIFKTFSGQKGPTEILEKQKKALVDPATAKPDWISQREEEVASWKFDARAGGHAYSQGFSANDDGSNDRSPFYPAIELLSIAGAAFFFTPQAWLRDEDSLSYFAWRTELLLQLAPFAAAGLLDGVAGRTYCLSTSGNAYGNGEYYRHFPEATPL